MSRAEEQARCLKSSLELLASNPPDSDDWTIHRLRELYEQGERGAGARVSWRELPNGSTAYFTAVRRADGSIELPPREPE